MTIASDAAGIVDWCITVTGLIIRSLLGSRLTNTRANPVDSRLLFPPPAANAVTALTFSARGHP